MGEDKSSFQVLERVVPEDTIRQWQNVVNTLAGIFRAPAGLIMRVHEKEIEVFVSSETEGNPYTVGASEHLHGKLYCETVMNDDRLLYIDDALKYDGWKDNPDVPLNMTSYLGIPIHWPSGETFGTICVLDSKPVKPTDAPKAYQDLLWSFGMIVEDQLKLLFEIEERKSIEKELTNTNETLEQRVQERTSELEKSNKQAQHLNAVLRAIRNVNQLITREQNRNLLLKGACSCLIETWGYRYAWIGLLNGKKTVSKLDQAGLDSAAILLEKQLSKGIQPFCTSKALNSSDTVIMTDETRSDCADCALTEKCAGMTGLSRRLEFEAKTFGVLNVAMPGGFAEEKEELSLFEEAAGDIGFALHSIELKESHERSKDALRDSEAFTRAVLDNLPVGIAVNSVDPTVNFSYMNDNFPKFYRTTRKALADPDTFWEAVYEDPEFREKIKKRVLDDCASGDPEKLYWEDIPITRKGQETSYITARNIPVPGKQLMISMVWDVTERKKTEEELEKFRIAVESSSDAVGMSTPEGRHYYQNKAFSDLFGDVGHNPPDTLYVDEHIGRDVFDAIMRGDAWNGEVKMHGKNGTELDILLRAYSLKDAKGKIIGLVGVHTDITGIKNTLKEKEHLQNQLLQSQKMEAVGTLAGGVAHDFNNLLTVIKGHSDLSLMKLKESDALYPDIQQIKESADRAANLTRQLLLYSRRQPMNFEQLNINDTVNGLLKMLGRLIGEDVRIQTDLSDEIWNVKADPGNIEQVIMNLAVNARDAMPDGGKLTFRTGNIRIDEHYLEAYSYAKAGKHVFLEIEDTGMGMDKSTIDRIFEPFFTTKGAGKGTGLGMSVVYGIVREHNGWINVYSEVGQGTTFKIYLPATFEKGHPKAKTAEIIKDLQGKGERILLVEDEETVLYATQKLLEESGYEIIHALNAEAALEVFKEHGGNFDLLFTDTILPDRNGLQLIDDVRAIKPELRVLLSSGYTGERIQREALQEKHLPFIQKPYDLTDLLRVVKEAIYRKME